MLPIKDVGIRNIKQS